MPPSSTGHVVIRRDTLEVRPLHRPDKAEKGSVRFNISDARLEGKLRKQILRRIKSLSCVTDAQIPDANKLMVHVVQPGSNTTTAVTKCFLGVLDQHGYSYQVISAR